MKRKGFTLIELLVALGVFSVVIMIAVGAFVNALRTQRETSSLIAAQSNVSLTLEQMAREIRTGYYFCSTATSTLAQSKDTPSAACASACTILYHTNNPNRPDEWQCSVLDFWNAHGCEVQYAASGGALTRSDQCGADSSPQPVTAPNVVVKDLAFTIFGNMVDDSWDPRITISLGIAPSSTDPVVASSTLNVQTTVSARNCGSLVGGC